MNQKTPGYAVGRWESLWPCEPYMTHKVLLGLAEPVPMPPRKPKQQSQEGPEQTTLLD